MRRKPRDRARTFVHTASGLFTFVCAAVYTNKYPSSSRSSTVCESVPGTEGAGCVASVRSGSTYHIIVLLGRSDGLREAARGRGAPQQQDEYNRNSQARFVISVLASWRKRSPHGTALASGCVQGRAAVLANKQPTRIPTILSRRHPGAAMHVSPPAERC